MLDDDFGDINFEALYASLAYAQSVRENVEIFVGTLRHMQSSLRLRISVLSHAKMRDCGDSRC